MNIGMILDKSFPPDIRVEKEASALIEAGHMVHLLAYRKEQSSEPSEEGCNGIRVSRIPVARQALVRPLKSANALVFHLGFRDYYWYRQLKHYVRHFGIDVLHVHDLPLAGTAIALGKHMNVPVVVDLHENWPAALQVWGRRGNAFRNWLERNHRRWVRNERWTVNHASHVIVVVDEAKQRLIERYGVSSPKVTVLMNTADTDRIDEQSIDSDVLESSGDDFIVSYVGGVGPHRGVDTAVLSMKYLADLEPRVQLLLVGATGPYAADLVRLIEREELEKRVEVLGWQPFEKVSSYISTSSVCLIPHHKSDHTDNTIPHKLFQYMYLGKPVVVSDCLPLKRIVEETGSGLVFAASDPEDLARAIRQLHSQNELCAKCGSQGRRAVIERYNWKEESKKLLKVYNQLGESDPIERRDLSS